MLPDVLEEAQRCAAAWAARQTAIAAESQQGWKEQPENRNAVDGQRVAGSLAMALRRGHDTFSSLLAPSTGAVQRWQQAMLLFTAIMGAQALRAGPTRIAKRRGSHPVALGP